MYAKIKKYYSISITIAFLFILSYLAYKEFSNPIPDWKNKKDYWAQRHNTIVPVAQKGDWQIVSKLDMPSCEKQKDGLAIYYKDYEIFINGEDEYSNGIELELYKNKRFVLSTGKKYGSFFPGELIILPRNENRAAKFKLRDINFDGKYDIGLNLNKKFDKTKSAKTQLQTILPKE